VSKRTYHPDSGDLPRPSLILCDYLKSFACRERSAKSTEMRAGMNVTTAILPSAAASQQFHLAITKYLRLISAWLPFGYLTTPPGKKPSNFLARTGCCNLRIALASTWRTRSRVTLKIRPTSSSV